MFEQESLGFEPKKLGDRIAQVDLNRYLSGIDQHWQDDLLAAAHAARPIRVTESETSKRAGGDTEDLYMSTLNGMELLDMVPWLKEIVKDNELLDVVGSVVETPVCRPSVPGFQLHQLIMNVLHPGQSYEPHVDANGATILLPVTSHTGKNDGELIIASDSDRRGFFEPLESDMVIPPEAGIATILDGTDRTHWVRSPSDGVRVSLVVNMFSVAGQERNRGEKIDRAIGLLGIQE